MSETTQPISTLPDPLQAGRDALVRHAWAEAYEQFQLADTQGSLGGEDLEGLAQASFFAAHPETELVAKERAFKAYETQAMWNARRTWRSTSPARTCSPGSVSIASAWIRRAERLVGAAGETYVHGYLVAAAERDGGRRRRPGCGTRARKPGGRDRRAGRRRGPQGLRDDQPRLAQDRLRGDDATVSR